MGPWRMSFIKKHSLHSNPFEFSWPTELWKHSVYLTQSVNISSVLNRLYLMKIAQRFLTVYQRLGWHESAKSGAALYHLGYLKSVGPSTAWTGWLNCECVMRFTPKLCVRQTRESSAWMIQESNLPCSPTVFPIFEHCRWQKMVDMMGFISAWRLITIS